MTDKRRLVQTTLDRLGYALVPKWRMPGLPAANYLKRLFEWLEVGCVIDVGANAGQYHDFLRQQVGFRGLIVSFEPIPAMIERLRARARGEPEWVIEACALGAASGQARFHIAQESEFSSLRASNSEAVERFGDMTGRTQQIDVEVRTLDDAMRVLAPRIGARPLYLKLDTQGSDLDVLRGGGDTLARILALQTEMAVRPLYEGAPDFTQALPQLRALGFEPSAMFQNNDGHFPWLLEFDCYLVARHRMPDPGAGR